MDATAKQVRKLRAEVNELREQVRYLDAKLEHVERVAVDASDAVFGEPDAQVADRFASELARVDDVVTALMHEETSEDD